MPDAHCTRPTGPCKGLLSFASVTHDLGGDPRLSAADVRVAGALLFFARSDDSCWPSDPSIAARARCSVGTVQRCL